METRVLGIEQAVAALREMSVAITKRVTRKAIRQATRVVFKVAKSTTYDGSNRTKRTGLLGRSIAMAISTKRDLVTGKIVMRPVEIKGKGRAAQGTMPAFYWRFLEKGTKPRATKHGGNRGALSPRPWVVPAFNATNSNALEKFKQVFESETALEARRIASKQGRPR